MVSLELFQNLLLRTLGKDRIHTVGNHRHPLTIGGKEIDEVPP